MVFYSILAGCNVVSALVIRAVFAVRAPWPAKLGIYALALALIAGLAYCRYSAFAYLSGLPPVLGIDFFLMLAAPQAIYHTITLWPLWMCGYLGPRDDGSGGPRETSPATASPFAQ